MTPVYGSLKPLLHFDKRGLKLSMADEDWDDTENDLIVADYFAMLTDELAGRRYNKSEHRRNLLELLPKRNNSAIEFKHRNISAAMDFLGQQRIDGYKSLYSYQGSLVDAVIRWLDANPEWTATNHTEAVDEVGNSLKDGTDAVLWIGPAPTYSNEPPPVDPKFAAAVAKKYDVAQRDARNRALGKAGEERVLLHEKTVLQNSHRSDLADKVRWTAMEEGDGAGFDIFSFEPDGRERLIEVKTTNGWDRTPFHITRNEIAVAEANRDTWHLVRLWNFSRKPRAFSICPPLDAHVLLTATSFLASLH
ncbi:DUF3883 domain-containing protein [Erythrobacter sp. SDW2]|uniref:DUF3883 domain-containing protein n=1 Tax=Erythrobacter sp. SDW2 TaxID=2907154 RepID=UPI001F3EB3FE|nr:DUF3883 domain-containing protein [Erythrobacter sp. SDW2]UIP06925.1 DUF3883 domain-containing protein [Erythrobacter sp. SDW2]